MVDLLLAELDLTTLLTLVERRGMGWMDARVKQAIVDARDQDSGHSLLHKAVVSGSLEGTRLCVVSCRVVSSLKGASHTTLKR